MKPFAPTFQKYCEDPGKFRAWMKSTAGKYCTSWKNQKGVPWDDITCGICTNKECEEGPQKTLEAMFT